LVVWTFPTATRITQIKHENGDAPDILIVLSGMFIGTQVSSSLHLSNDIMQMQALNNSQQTQGIWNALIYFRPRYNKCEDDWPVYRKIWSLVHATLLFWTCKGKDYAHDDKDYVQNNDNNVTPTAVSPDDCVPDYDTKGMNNVEVDQNSWNKNGGTMNN
jgi:hypothetical protein